MSRPTMSIPSFGGVSAEGGRGGFFNVQGVSANDGRGGFCCPPALRHVLFLFAFLCAVACLPCHAQPPGIDTLDIPGFTYDSRFLIGYNCVSLGDTTILPFLAERMRADYTYTYGGPGSAKMAFFRNPSLWDSGNAGLLFVQRSEAAYWLQREIYPVKAIYAPGSVRVAGNSAMSVENFYQSTAGDTLHRMTLDKMGATPDTTVGFLTQLLNAGTFLPCATPPCDVAIAGFPKYTNNAMVLENADPISFYSRIGDPSTIEDFDAAFAMRADTSSQGLGVPEIPNNAVIAYAILYRRDTTAQGFNWPGAPRCALFTPFDTVFITKGLYLDSTNVNVHLRNDRFPNEPSFREFYFPIHFPTASKSLPRDSAIIAGNTLRWGGGTWHPYVPKETYLGWGDGAYNPLCDQLDSLLIARGVLDSGTVNYHEGG